MAIGKHSYIKKNDFKKIVTHPRLDPKVNSINANKMISIVGSGGK